MKDYYRLVKKLNICLGMMKKNCPVFTKCCCGACLKIKNILKDEREEMEENGSTGNI